MKEQNEWIPFTEIDWNDVENNRFNVDTRDFHCGYFLSKEPHKDLKTLEKYDSFFHTEQEVKDFVKRLYDESGGKNEWRMIDLVSNDSRVLHWKLKYLRIFREEKGFIVCNSDNVAIPKYVLACKVNQEYLSAH